MSGPAAADAPVAAEGWGCHGIPESGWDWGRRGRIRAWTDNRLVSNCLVYAVNRWRKAGGYIVVRKSHHGWWPHFLWTADFNTFFEFTPVKPNDELKSPPVLFKGYVRERTKNEA